MIATPAALPRIKVRNERESFLSRSEYIYVVNTECTSLRYLGFRAGVVSPL
jgi:hypothetical protein